LLTSLGFKISNKSNLIANTRFKYLGFIFDTQIMSIELPQVKKDKVLKYCNLVYTKDRITLQILSECIGNLIAAVPAIKFGMLYTRQLEYEKSSTLLQNNYNYKDSIIISEESKEDLKWFIDKIPTSYNTLRSDSYDIVLYSDASMSGWGGSMLDKVTRGSWNTEERLLHINELELKAVYNVLRSFSTYVCNKSVLVRVDSTVALSYINKYGGCRAPNLHKIAKDIYIFVERNNIIISASYINTKDNVIADYASRLEQDESDWMLNIEIFNNVCKTFNFVPNIDLFATYLTKQLNIFCSWFPDPEASYVDAFTLNWEHFKIYVFPPFCLILRALKKLINDKAEGLFVVPFWPTQPWWPIFKSLVQTEMLILEPSRNLLKSFVFSRPHPLAKTLKLVAAMLSAKDF
jgi:hypothetical protein